MRTYTLSTLGGKRSRIPVDQVEVFGSSLRGEFLTPQSPRYEAARTVWNAMVDRRPGLIARCAGEADVIQALEFARPHALLVALRGGGHNIAGLGSATAASSSTSRPCGRSTSIRMRAPPRWSPAAPWTTSTTTRRSSASPRRSESTPPRASPA